MKYALRCELDSTVTAERREHTTSKRTDPNRMEWSFPVGGAYYDEHGRREAFSTSEPLSRLLGILHALALWFLTYCRPKMCRHAV
jgi:hypothetical protein